MTPQLRPALHPGQSDTLVHFCGRARQSFSMLSPSERLERILYEGRISGTNPYGSTMPAVCLSESTIDGIRTLIEAGGFEPWAVVLSRAWVWDQGGGPVWYVRDELWREAVQSLGPDHARWLVRSEPNNSDWLHEREWRVPVDPENPHFNLPASGPLAIVVGDAEWEPSLVHTYEISPFTGGIAQVLMTPAHAQVDRWLWTGTRFELLSPIQRCIYVN